MPVNNPVAVHWHLVVSIYKFDPQLKAVTSENWLLKTLAQHCGKSHTTQKHLQIQYKI